MTESKKIALIRILQIFYKYSDAEHRLKQDDIVQKLYDDYGIVLERKAVGRNISLLKEAGFEIESGGGGSYLAERAFEDSELRLLIDGVLSSRHITENHSKELIEKLCAMSNKYFRSRVKNIYSVGDWSKTDNCTLFYNIDCVDEAIESSRQLKFRYNRYDTDKKLHKGSEHVVSAFQLLLHNGRYYLFAFSEKRGDTVFYRVDRITDMEITNIPSRNLRSVAGYENGLDYRELSSAFPYMYADKAETVEFSADAFIVDQIVDWFGYEAQISETGNGKIHVKVSASLKAMEYWAMQYCNYVQILYPLSLRDRVGENLSRAAKIYGK